ncbi:hypothetical protein GB931_12575 [Modestobacter sp. I12A-02628]|uniref:Uncharacterized protein n=1 Tax=Goekera deserti TaxID=2497753 RepID=A0A7K3WB40_9ACTN|nr:hypothetical protein [Goekera deserti]MPQ98739.1 hypothetical protein [Goekera deserti]NEL53040.1 hypothetical protein [Goekera deserti]
MLYAYVALQYHPFDIGEHCELHYGQPFDAKAYLELSSDIPVRQFCNPTFDMVPAYINPVLAISLSAVVISLGRWLRQHFRSRT